MATNEIDLKTKMEDHALEEVPHHARNGWGKLSWNTAGICTTLVILFFGALTSFVAGIRIALYAGLFVTLVGSLIGWATGHIAYSTGLSSTVMARNYGFGKHGSIIGSLILGFMIIGFLALENSLLYSGFRFAFNLANTLTNQIMIYGLLTVAWVLLTAYGFELVSRVSSWTLVAFLALLLYMTVTVVSQHAQGNIWSFPALFPPEVLASMHASTDMGKFIFCVNVLIGSSGALALVDADIGRYAKSSKDIGIAATLANMAMCLGMVTIGGIFMYAGMGKIVEHYIDVAKMAPQAAQQAAMSPDGVTATFLLFGGMVGVLLMVLAQSKAQVLNTYSASLALSNIFDALGARMRRVAMVVLANLIGLAMVAMNILGRVQSWIEILGVLTTAFATIMIVDFFFVAKGRPNTDENFNWAGVLTTIIATALAHYVLNQIIPIQFFSSVVISAVLYPVLRATLLKGSVCTKPELVS